MIDLNKTFSRRAVAQRLGVSLKTIDRWADRGLIRKVRLSARRVIIDPHSLRRLLGDELFNSTFNEVS